MRMRHKYVDNRRVNAATGVMGRQVYSCNGLFDPDFTNTGHQPLFFDNMTAIYDHYTCFVSRIDIAFSTDTDSYVSLYVDDDTTHTATVQTGAEQPTGVEALCLSLNNKPMHLRSSWNARDYFGGDIFDNDQLQGTNAANPAEASYYVLSWQSANQTNSSALTWTATIYYDVVWDEIKTQAEN